MLKHITSWSYRHRRLVVAAWVAVLVAINVAAMSFGGESKQEFLSPGTDSKAAVELLDERFPDRAGDTVTVVVHDDEGVTSAGVLAVAEPVVDRVRVAAARRRRGRSVGGRRRGAGVRRRHDGVRRRPARHHGCPLPGRRRRPRWSTSPPTLVRTASQMELSGQAIENVQSSSMGAEGPGLAHRRADPADRLRVARRHGPAARHRAVRRRGRPGRRQAARQRHRRPRVGELRRDHDRPRCRHRLRAADPHPLPQRARHRRRAPAGRGDRDGDRRDGRSSSPGSPSSSRCSAC